jgi:hypothetical protein
MLTCEVLIPSIPKQLGLVKHSNSLTINSMYLNHIDYFQGGSLYNPKGNITTTSKISRNIQISNPIYNAWSDTHKTSHIHTNVFSNLISIWINHEILFSLHVLHVKDNRFVNPNNMHIHDMHSFQKNKLL